MTKYEDMVEGKHHKKFETFAEAMEVLKGHVAMRDKMGGSMYWNIINDECCEIANKLKGLDTEGLYNYQAIKDLLGSGNSR